MLVLPAGAYGLRLGPCLCCLISCWAEDAPVFSLYLCAPYLCFLYHMCTLCRPCSGSCGQSLQPALLRAP